MRGIEPPCTLQIFELENKLNPANTLTYYEHLKLHKLYHVYKSFLKNYRFDSDNSQSILFILRFSSMDVTFLDLL